MRICCVIVTYNRKELVLRCISRCLKQELEPDILVFDNNSTDGTKAYLKEYNVLTNKRIIYHMSVLNIGGAGGFSRGMKLAYEMGYDYIWLMDDDGYPLENDCLSQALNVYTRYDIGSVIVNSLVITADKRKLSFMTNGYEYVNEVKNKYTDGEMKGAISPFNGTLYSRKVIDKIGFPREDFFIKGDETEYTCRAKANGIEVITATNSEFYHPTIPATKKKLLFFYIKFSGEPYWKEYYTARNYVYIYRKYYSTFQLFKHISMCFLKCLLYENDKKRKRKYTLMGLLDGFRNKFVNIEIAP